MQSDNQKSKKRKSPTQKDEIGDYYLKLNLDNGKKQREVLPGEAGKNWSSAE